MFPIKRDKAEIIRGVVATLLWIMLALCLLTMIRANGMMAKNLRLLEEGAVSPEQYNAQLLITETARGFVFNWATFNKDKAEYQSRLQAYGKNDNYSHGNGIQKCNSADVLEITKVTDWYRVILEVNVSRVVLVPENESYLIAEEQIISINKADEGNTISVWKDFRETVEVSVREKGKDIIILGYPSLIASRSLTEVKTYNLLELNNPPDSFKIFGRQMLTLYYQGEDLSNYEQPNNNSQVSTLGGYDLNKYEIIGYQDEGDFIKSVLKVEISSTDGSIDRMEQYVSISAKQIDGKWFLLRMGAY